MNQMINMLDWIYIMRNANSKKKKWNRDETYNFWTEITKDSN